MFCPWCGKVIHDESTFCKFCGKRVGSELTVPEQSNPSPPSAIVQGNTDLSKPNTNASECNSVVNRVEKPRPIMLAVVVAIAVAFCIFIVVNKTSNLSDSSTDNSINQFDNTEIKNAKVGDIITFGCYEQDNNLDNGSEPIEWVVLDAQDDKILVMSLYVLDYVQYNKEKYANTDYIWNNCTLRIWLNGHFYNTAFSDLEQSLFARVPLRNDNLDHNGTSADDTYDRAFLLSCDEIREYFVLNMWDEERHTGYSQLLIAEPTEYAMSKDDMPFPPYKCRIDDDYYRVMMEEYEGDESANWIKPYSQDIIGRIGTDWWIRSMSEITGDACEVGFLGQVGRSTYTGVANYSGLRPAIWLNK